MKCPFCGHDNTRVIDSRPADENNSIRRRRVCDECGKRFTTYEKIETIPLIVIKKDNNRETYDRSKIEAGVLRACHKRLRSRSGQDQASHLIQIHSVQRLIQLIQHLRIQGVQRLRTVDGGHGIWTFFLQQYVRHNGSSLLWQPPPKQRQHHGKKRFLRGVFHPQNALSHIPYPL